MARKRSLFFPRIQSPLSWQMPLLSLAIAILIVLIPVRTASVFSAVTPAAKMESLLQQGRELYDRQQYSDAVQILQQAVSGFEALGDRQGKAIALSNLSLVYQQQGQWQLAEEAVAASLNLLPTLASDLDSASAQILAQTLNVRGRLKLKQGKSQAALNTWQQTTELYRQLKDATGIIRSQINQAQAMGDLGLYFQAEKILTKTAQQLQDNSNPTLKAIALRSLGGVYRATGNLTKSRQTLEQSLAVATANKLPTGDIFLSLGNTARAQGKSQAALAFYQEATSNASDTLSHIQGQLNQLRLIVDRNPQAARQLATAIESQIKDLPPSRQAVYARINLVENWQRLRSGVDKDVFDPSKLIDILTEAQQEAEALGDTSAISYALGNLGEIYAQSGQSPRAMDITQQALYLAQVVNQPHITYLWQWQLGRLQKAAGQTTEAIASYTKAVNTLQNLRSNLAALDPEVQDDFRVKVEPVYRQLVDLLLESEPTQANLASARQTIESLQLLELENFFRQACLEPKSEIDAIADSSNSAEAVIYPIILPDRLEVIVKLFQQNQLVHFTTPINGDDLQTEIALLREDLLDVTKTAEVKRRSQQLYRWLIEPMAATLAQNQIDTLVFVLNGSLRNIPMSVLYDEAEQQYLIEQYAIAVAPGLQLVKSQSLSATKLNVLTGGIGRSRTIAGRDFASLDNVQQELEQIQSHAAKSKQIIDQEFTTANLQNQLDIASFSTVHLATHGEFSSNPEQTFILTWNELLKTQDLASLMRQYSSNQNDGIELLVLSACETAAGDRLAALGLAGIAVRAGVKSTLASLWFADDRYSAEIMSNFYQELSQGTTKAKALQQAQIAILEQENRPYLWSSFVLLGNWL